MSILIANGTYPPDVNASAHFTKCLAEGLAGREHEVHVVCASTSRPNEVATRDGVVEHRLRSVPGTRGFALLASALAAAQARPPAVATAGEARP